MPSSEPLTAGSHRRRSDDRTDVSFVVQNETHAQNFTAIVHCLETEHGIGGRVQMLHLDDASGLDTMPAGTHVSRRVDLPRTAPFYGLDAWRRVRYLQRAAEKLDAAASGTRVLVIGNDGALQRRMARRVRAEGGKVLMIVDGLLSAPRRTVRARSRAVAKRAVFLAAYAVGLDHFVPSDLGFLPVDAIFVMDETTKRALEERAVSAPVEIVVLPRLARDRTVYAARRAEVGPGERAITYVTSAFRWHGNARGEVTQRFDLEDFDRLATSRPDVRFRVRRHPREESGWYRERSWAPNVEVSDVTTPLADDLAAAATIVTARSTVGLEAALLGLPVLIYTKNFGDPEPGSFFAESPALRRSSDLSEAIGLTPTGAVPSPGSMGAGADAAARYLADRIAAAIDATDGDAMREGTAR